MVKVSVLGSGYVGLVVGACLADFGVQVTCADKDTQKISDLNHGKIPIYEPGLEEVVRKNVYYGRLKFTADLKAAIEEGQVLFIAVGTPPAEDGSADMSYVMKAAGDIGKFMNGYKVIVNKSTVPVGTGKKVREVINRQLQERGMNFSFDVVSNPEFLREGSAVKDFIYPDRIVLGMESERAESLIDEVFQVFRQNGVPFILTDLETAELSKYASNAFLALKISYINELANLAEHFGANILKVAEIMGLDKRISPDFLKPGPGYGGSCFPKDTKALARMGRDQDTPLTLIEQTIAVNEKQKIQMVDKVKEAMGSLEGKILAILGITFKAGTDDLREAPSLVILDRLMRSGSNLRIYDPEGEKEGRWRLEYMKEHLTFCSDEYQASVGADAVIILTDWEQFKTLDLDWLKEKMKDHFFFDLRNIYERSVVEAKGFQYYGVGR